VPAAPAAAPEPAVVPEPEHPAAPEAPRRSRHAAPDDESAPAAARVGTWEERAEVTESVAAESVWAPAAMRDQGPEPAPEVSPRPDLGPSGPSPMPEPQPAAARESAATPQAPEPEPRPESAISVDELLAAYGLASTSRRRRRDRATES
jgi:hypothetical protein